MGLSINTNVQSLVAQRSLATNTMQLNGSMEKLSTGFRINKAADDAAGLTISETLKSQYRGADIAQANAQDGINMLQVAEGDLGVIQDNLQRVRELTVQASNDTNGTAEKTAIISEIDARLSEIDRIAQGSEFNGKNLLDGTTGTVEFQVGANSGDTITGTSVFTDSDVAALSLDSHGLTKTSTNTNFGAFLDKVDTAIAGVSDKRSDIGSVQNRLESSVESVQIKSENLKAAESRIRDVDVAQESAQMVKSQILQQASISMLAQANQAPGLAMSLL